MSKPSHRSKLVQRVSYFIFGEERANCEVHVAELPSTNVDQTVFEA